MKPDKQRGTIEMVTRRQRSQRRQRFRRNCRVTSGKALSIAILSFAFARIYLHLYGAHPAIIPRLGTTVAVLCVGVAGLFAVFGILSVLTEGVTALWRRWIPRLWGIR